MEAILLQVILIGLNAVFASAEIAVISMNDTKLERMARDGDARAKRLAALTAQPTKFLSTIQVAITLAGQYIWQVPHLMQALKSTWGRSIRQLPVCAESNT